MGERRKQAQQERHLPFPVTCNKDRGGTAEKETNTEAEIPAMSSNSCVTEMHQICLQAFDEWAFAR